MHTLIPKPCDLVKALEEWTLSNLTYILDETMTAEVTPLAHYLADLLEHETGYQIAVAANSEENQDGSIRLALNGDISLGEEGYELSIRKDSVLLRASQPAGLFYGIQTLRQLLPPRHSGIVSLPAVSIRDTPRFAWRGAMLDVARHFFCVEDVKRFIDLIAHYKMNRLHLHLTDDQGWRIQIKAWPKLTEIGGQTQVNGGGGGYYTQDQYEEIMEYARNRFVTIVPEIDAPGHTNAALASYVELNCSGQAPALYEGTEVGFSSLCIDQEITYQFLNDVIGELAALTPTPYIHIGGDEARSTSEQDYKKFIRRIQQIVFCHNKIPVGWAEIGGAELDSRTIAQHWVGASYRGAQQQGCKIILSPANKTYLDMKYDASTPLGLDWAGHISVQDSYDWEPGSYMDGLEEGDILGIEAPLWSETLSTMNEIEYMAFPRLAGIAELAWSPNGRVWDEYKVRLAAHEPHMESLGINFFRDPDAVKE